MVRSVLIFSTSLQPMEPGNRQHRHNRAGPLPTPTARLHLGTRAEGKRTTAGAVPRTEAIKMVQCSSVRARRVQVQFIDIDLGHCEAGDIAEVTLSAGANVRLMDNSNFNAYRNGRAHRYQGGLAKQSPVRLQIPASGHWHVAVDMQGLRGTVRAGGRKIPGSLVRPLPPLREHRDDLQQIADNLAHATSTAEDHRDFDVFISHASEDKDEVVRPLAKALHDGGISVWYDEFELKIGDSLRRKIDAGISSSRFGIVVLSPRFFAKGWTQYELDGLVTMTVSANQVLLPLWHGISKDEVIRHSPSLADKVALRTADYTISEIANEIATVVASHKPR